MSLAPGTKADPHQELGDTVLLLLRPIQMVVLLLVSPSGPSTRPDSAAVPGTHSLPPLLTQSLAAAAYVAVLVDRL
jgi:hypothetical protein